MIDVGHRDRREGGEQCLPRHASRRSSSTLTSRPRIHWAFGFDEGFLHRDDDGQVVHGEVYAAGESIWLHRTTTDHGLASPQSQGMAFGGLAVLIDDVDAHCEHARAAGAVIDHAPQDQPYGRREYGARDPEGHRWWFGTETS